MDIAGSNLAKHGASSPACSVHRAWLTLGILCRSKQRQPPKQHPTY
jgi:hypothetical protein